MSWQSTPLRGFRISGRRAGKFAERDGRRQQRVETRIGAAARSRLRAAGDGSTSARCEGATLPTWLEIELQAAAVERAAERHRDVARAVPAQLDDGRLVAGEIERGREPLGRWRWRGTRNRNRVGAASGVAKLSPSAAASAARAGSMSTSVTSAPSIRAQRYPTSAPTTPAPTTAIRPDGPGRGVPGGVERRLHVGGEHRARRRHAVRHRHAPPRPADRTCV